MADLQPHRHRGTAWSRTPGTGRIRSLPGLGPQVFYQLTEHDAERLARGVELTAEALFAAGARRVLLPVDGAPVVRGPDELPPPAGPAGAEAVPPALLDPPDGPLRG